MSWNQSSSLPVDVRDERVSSFLGKVYGWMFAGLLVTSVTAFAVASSEGLIETFIENRLLFWILLFAQLGLVFFLSARVNTMAPAMAAGLFILYSALSGSNRVCGSAPLHGFIDCDDICGYCRDVWRHGHLRIND